MNWGKFKEILFLAAQIWLKANQRCPKTGLEIEISDIFTVSEISFDWAYLTNSEKQWAETAWKKVVANCKIEIRARRKRVPVYSNLSKHYREIMFWEDVLVNVAVYKPKYYPSTKLLSAFEEGIYLDARNWQEAMRKKKLPQKLIEIALAEGVDPYKQDEQKIVKWFQDHLTIIPLPLPLPYIGDAEVDVKKEVDFSALTKWIK